MILFPPATASLIVCPDLRRVARGIACIRLCGDAHESAHEYNEDGNRDTHGDGDGDVELKGSQ
jgi:hypothetical protein